MKKNKKSNKKKLLAIFLFLFAVSGVIGFGAYSYYWTRGDFTVNEDTIEIIAFDPEVYSHRYSNSSETFLGNGDTLDLDCVKNESNGNQYTCTGRATIINRGGTDIDLEIEDENIYVSELEDVDIDYDYSFTLDETRLVPDGRTDLVITVQLEIDNGSVSGDGGYDPVEVHAPVTGGEFTVSASFKLKATQVQE